MDMATELSGRKRKRNGNPESECDGRQVKFQGQASLEISKRAEEGSGLESDRLCVQCAKINLDAVLSRKHKAYCGRIVARLGRTAKRAASSCPFCSLMAAILPPSESGSSGASLRAYSSRKSQLMGWNLITTVMLQPQRKDYGNRIRSDVPFLVPRSGKVTGVRLLKEDSIDFDIAGYSSVTTGTQQRAAFELRQTFHPSK